MKTTKLFYVITIIILGLTLNSCYNDKYPVVDLTTPTTTVVSFATDIQPIFNSDCIACHNGSLDPDLREGNSYNALMSLPAGSIVPGNSKGSELMGMLNHDPAADNPMPPGSQISMAKRTLFANWIDQGAKNN